MLKVKLTPREARAVNLHRQGKTWNEIRAALGTSQRDAKRYVRRALGKERHTQEAKKSA